MSKKIVIKKTKTKNFIVVKEKHKIIDIIGFLNEKNQIQNLNKDKFNVYLKNCIFISNTLLSKLKQYQMNNLI